MMIDNLKDRKVTICIANNTWYGKRPWYQPTTSVPIITRILKPLVDLSLVDANGYRLSVEETKRQIAELSPEILLIPALSAEYHKAYHTIARIAKEINSSCIVVMGGVYPTVLAEDIIQDKNVDYAFIGHAEERLDVFLSYVLQDERDGIDKFPGVARMDHGTPKITPVKTYIGDVKKMVQPDYSLLNLENYFSFNDVTIADFTSSSNKREATVITSYGCPNNCFFCATRTISGRKTAFRPANDVLDEIDFLVKKYHIASIVFLDDCILTDRKRAEDIFQGIIDRKYNLELKMMNLAAWQLDEEILKLMKEAGFSRIGIAIESGSDRVLHKIIRKPLRLEIIPPLVKLARKYDILMPADFIIGLPGETWDEIRETFRFADACDLDLCMFHIASPLPKTELYYTALEQGMLPKDFSFYKDGIGMGFAKGCITSSEFTPQELMILRAYEWDRINFATPERKKRACRVMEISEEQMDEHRRQTRRKMGVHF